MTTIYERFGLENPQTMPPCPEAALILGVIFQRLGGAFHIEHGGQRRISMPCAGAFEGKEGEWDIYPHAVVNAEPHERFLSGDQFEGALRLITALMKRLHPDDRTFLYDSFAIATTQIDIEQAGGAAQ